MSRACRANPPRAWQARSSIRPSPASCEARSPTAFDPMKLRLTLSCLLLAGAPDLSTFRSPPAEYGAIHWVSFFLSRATEQSLTASVHAAAQTGAWGSFELGPGGGPTTGLSPAYLAASQRTPSSEGVPYLSDEYFRLYRAAIEQGQKDHFPASMFYDEWAYP